MKLLVMGIVLAILSWLYFSRASEERRKRHLAARRQARLSKLDRRAKRRVEKRNNEIIQQHLAKWKMASERLKAEPNNPYVVHQYKVAWETLLAFMRLQRGYVHVEA